MRIEEFERLLDAYGAEPGRWPSERRTAALALAKSDPSAAAALVQAQALDELLNAAPAQAPSLALRTAVATAALGAGSRRPARPRSYPARWAVAAALAAASAAGLVTGVAAATRQVQPERTVISADPAVEAGRLLDPAEAEG